MPLVAHWCKDLGTTWHLSWYRREALGTDEGQGEDYNLPGTQMHRGTRHRCQLRM